MKTKSAKSVKPEFQIERTTGKTTFSPIAKNLTGGPAELLSELRQNTEDNKTPGQVSVLKFIKTSVSQKDLNAHTGLDALAKKLKYRKSIEHKDNRAKYFDDYIKNFEGDEKVSVLIAQDNGPGLDGDADRFLVAQKRSSGKPVRGGFYNFIFSEGVQSKSADKGGQHGVGAKVALSLSSYMYGSFTYTRRTCDQESYFTGTMNIGPREDREGNTLNPNLIFHKKASESNQSFSVGDEADKLAEFFGVDTQGTGVSHVMPYLKDNFTDFEILLGAVKVLYTSVLSGEFEFHYENTETAQTTILSKENIFTVISSIKKMPEFKALEPKEKHSYDLLFKNIKEIKAILDCENDLDDENTYNVDTKIARGELSFDDDTKEKLRKTEFENGFAKFNLKISTTAQDSTKAIEDSFQVVLNFHGKGQGINSFYRSGIVISMPNNSKNGVTAFVRFDASSQIARCLRDCETANHTKWNQHSSVAKSNWKGVPRIVSLIQNSVDAILDAINADDEGAVDNIMFGDLFGDPDALSLYGPKFDYPDGDYTGEADKKDEMDKEDLLVSKLLEISDRFKDGTQFLVNLTEEGKEHIASNGPLNLSIVQGYEEWSAQSKISDKYGSTNITGQWEFNGKDTSAEIFESSDGRSLNIYNIDENFELYIANADERRAPMLKVTVIEPEKILEAA